MLKKLSVTVLYKERSLQSSVYVISSHDVNLLGRNTLCQIKLDLILLFSRSKEERLPVQTPLGVRPGLGGQPCYKASSHPQDEIVETQWLTSG